jgi:hypothetical protein
MDVTAKEPVPAHVEDAEMGLKEGAQPSWTPEEEAKAVRKLDFWLITM